MSFQNIPLNSPSSGRRVSEVPVRAPRPVQFRSRVAFLLGVLFVVGQGAFSPLAQSADRYRAFYYNANGKLLHVEQVPDAQLPNRVLQDPSMMNFPTLTKADVPLVTGPNKKMSKFATVAVYYTYSDLVEPPPNKQNVQATPAKVEDLQWVAERTLAICLPRVGTDPCPYPKRCHCMTGGCCCY